LQKQNARASADEKLKGDLMKKISPGDLNKYITGLAISWDQNQQNLFT
jgi:hypothetical protein